MTEELPNPRSYKILRLEERKKIENFLLRGFSINQISHILKRSTATIFREVSINGKRENYKAKKAHLNALKSREKAYLKYRHPFSLEDEKIIIEEIKKDSSIRSIAIKIGCHKDTLRNFIRFKGWDLDGPSDTVNDRLEAVEQQIEIILDILRSTNVNN